MAGPLEGVRVAELTDLRGAIAGRILADLIVGKKIEEARDPSNIFQQPKNFAYVREPERKRIYAVNMQPSPENRGETILDISTDFSDWIDTDLLHFEAREITEALGGVEAVTPQQRILVEDLCAVGIGLRTNLALFVQDADPELSSRIATLAGARRQSLLALGLGRFEKALDLASLLHQKSAESALCGTNGVQSGSRPMGASEDASVATEQRTGAERERI